MPKNNSTICGFKCEELDDFPDDLKELRTSGKTKYHDFYELIALLYPGGPGLTRGIHCKSKLETERFQSVASKGLQRAHALAPRLVPASALYTHRVKTMTRNEGPDGPEGVHIFYFKVLAKT